MAVPVDVATRSFRKIRGQILPFLFLLYLVAFLDRTNIGFAALTMNADLAVTSAQYGLLTGIFFVGYFLFEIPSNLLLHRVGARTWIARILITWGAVAVLAGFVRNVPQLYAARFVLGVAEAGFFPGVLLYLTYWLGRRDQAQAIALFMTAVPVSFIVGAPLSGFILDQVHWLGMSSWRWLLVLEGLPAIVFGVATFFLLPSRPSEATFLDDEEKKSIAAVLEAERCQKFGSHFSALQSLTNARVWHLALISFTFQIGAYAIYFYMPQALNALAQGHTNTTIGLLVMIPHLAGLAAMVVVSRSSDRTLERRYHAAIPTMLAGMALILLGTTHSLEASMALWLIAAMGHYAFVGPFWSLPSDFLTEAGAASGIALVTSVGSLGGFVGPFLIGATANGPGGIYRGLAMAGVSLLLSATLTWMLPTRSSSRHLATAMGAGG